MIRRRRFLEDRKKRRRYCMAVTCQIHPTERLTLLAEIEPMSLVPKLLFNSRTESSLGLSGHLFLAYRDIFSAKGSVRGVHIYVVDCVNTGLYPLI